MIFNLAVAVILICIVLLVFMACAPVRFKMGQIRFIWMLFTAAFGIFVYYSEPLPETDLYRHYELVRQLPQGGEDMGYGAVYGFRFLCRLVAWLGNPGWLAFITTCLFGLTVDGIAASYARKNHAGHRTVILYYFCVFSCAGVFSVVSGIRNALVCAMVMYAYGSCYERSRFRYCLLCILACSIHIIGVLLVALIFVYHKIIESGKKRRTFAAILAVAALCRISISSGAVVYAAARLPGAYGMLLSAKISGYLSDDAVSGKTFLAPDAGQLLMMLNYGLLIVLMLYTVRKQYDQDMLIYFVALVALAGTGLQIVSGRLLMFIGLLSLPVLDTALTKSSGKAKWMMTPVCLLIFSMEIFYSSYSMFSHIYFHGHNYREFFAGLLSVH